MPRGIEWAEPQPKDLKQASSMRLLQKLRTKVAGAGGAVAVLVGIFLFTAGMVVSLKSLQVPGLRWIAASLVIIGAILMMVFIDRLSE